MKKFINCSLIFLLVISLCCISAFVIKNNGDTTPVAANSHVSVQNDLCALELAYPQKLTPVSLNNAGSPQGETIYVPTALSYTSGDVLGIYPHGITDTQDVYDEFSFDNDFGLPKFLLALPSLFLLTIIGGSLAVKLLIAVVIILVRGNKSKSTTKIASTTMASATIASPVTLRQYMADHPQGLGQNNAAMLLMPVAVSLFNLHNDGIVHLEVSPNSVTFSDGRCTLNAPQNDENSRYTTGFAAPEIYKGQSAWNLSDIYSFCALLSFVATGNIPENSLTRSVQDDLVSEDEFDSIINKGMALAPSDRFGSMEEILLKLSSYNIEPTASTLEELYDTILSESESTDSELTTNIAINQSLETESFKRIRVKNAIIYICCALIMLVSIYCLSYFTARFSAENGKYEFANNLLFAQKIVALHDPELLTYIEAGQSFEIQNFEKAEKKFSEVSGYLNADKMAKESAYCRAKQLADSGDFDIAISIYKKLSKVHYKDSIDLIPETRYRWGWSLYESENYVEAYEQFKKIINYSDVSTLIDDLEELIFIEGQNAYHQGKYSLARDYFECIPSYARSSDYLTLIEIRLMRSYNLKQDHVNALVDIFDFEDASELLVSNQDIAVMFLEGKWKTSGGSYYFTMNSDGQVSYTLPWFDYGDYYYIKDGEFRLHPDGDDDNYKTLFSFTPLSPDSIEVYCHKNEKTYTLYRK